MKVMHLLTSSIPTTSTNYFGTLKEIDKRLLLEKVLDLGNIAISVLFFTQFTNNQFKVKTGVVGVLILLGSYTFSIINLYERTHD